MDLVYLDFVDCLDFVDVFAMGGLLDLVFLDFSVGSLVYFENLDGARHARED